MKYDSVATLERVGISNDDARALRRISMTLRSWFEHECNGNIQRDEKTDKPYWYSTQDNTRRWSVADRERGAEKRLKAIMARYPSLGFYIQGDPRGASLYILRPGDIPDGATVDSCYSRGIVVCD